MCSLSSLPFKNPTANHRLNFITNSPRLNLDTDSYRFNFKTTTKNRLNLNTDNDRLNMLHDPNEDDYTLHVRQQPLTARVAVGKDKGESSKRREHLVFPTFLFLFSPCQPLPLFLVIAVKARTN